MTLIYLLKWTSFTTVWNIWAVFQLCLELTTPQAFWGNLCKHVIKLETPNWIKAGCGSLETEWWPAAKPEKLLACVLEMRGKGLLQFNTNSWLWYLRIPNKPVSPLTSKIKGWNFNAVGVNKCQDEHVGVNPYLPAGSKNRRLGSRREDSSGSSYRQVLPLRELDGLW